MAGLGDPVHGQTKVYEFYGHYFFNKATGDGGAWVTDFNINGQTFDPASLPGFPPQYGQDFGPGTGGFISHDAVDADPACAAKARRTPPRSIRARRTPRVRERDRQRRSPPHRAGAVGRDRGRRPLAPGPPQSVKRGFLRYCARRGGSLLIGEPGDRSGTFGSGGGAKAVILLTTSRQFALRSWRGAIVRVGSSSRALEGRRTPWRLLIRMGRGVWVRHRDLLAFVVRAAGSATSASISRLSIMRLRTLIGYLERAA